MTKILGITTPHEGRPVDLGIVSHQSPWRRKKIALNLIGPHVLEGLSLPFTSQISVQSLLLVSLIIGLVE
jgi:hypothetical protein